MAKKDRGWIKLYRQITDSYIWTSSDPFDRRSAWIDLLLMANHETRSIMLKNGHEQVIKAGQLFTSLDHLATRWHWSRNRVRRYLTLISAQGMCTVTGTPSGTLITVEKWRIYQQFGTSEEDDRHTYGQANGQANGQADGQTDGQRTRMYNKNVYNKNVRRKEAQAPDSSPWGGTRE